jgi:hypothetical protein
MALADQRILAPVERISEVLFGLIMVLTFTRSLDIFAVGRDDIRLMLVGALGCNLAWGLIDAVFYLMGCLAERAQALQAYRAVMGATNAEEARHRLVAALPPMVGTLLTPAELDGLRQRLQHIPQPPARASLERADWRGALGVFLLVFLSTFPVALPFIVMQDAPLALKVSNGVAVAMLLGLGYTYGRLTGRRPWLAGITMVVVGLFIVGITIALGG